MIRALRGRIKRPARMEILRYVIEGEEQEGSGLLGEVEISYRGKLRRIKGSWPGEETSGFVVSCGNEWSFSVPAQRMREGYATMMDIPRGGIISVRGQVKNFSIHFDVESLE